MKKSILFTSLTILLCLALSACSSANGKDSTQSESQGTEITLYANFATGCVEGMEGELIKTKTVTIPEVTAEAIAKELSAWSGLDFTLNSATVSENILTVDWSADSTLIANLDDREQKEDFHFFDADSLRWFMMESLYQTCMENMDISEIYYTMDGGKELFFEDLSPTSVFPKEVPYMGSPFYFAHADVQGDMGDSGDLEFYAPTEGTWRLEGAMDTAYIIMDGRGLFTTFYASGSVESEGYLTYFSDDGRYEMFTHDSTLWDVFYLTNETELVLGYDGEMVYKKDLAQ